MGHIAKELLVAFFWIAFVLSIAVHIAYPLAAAALLKLAGRRRSAASGTSGGFSSVSILLWDDDAQRAAGAVRRLLNINLPKSTEILLLGAAARISTDGLPEFVRPLPESESLARAGALKLAASKASGDAVVLLAPGAGFDRYGLRKLLECAEESDAGCAFALSGPRPRTLHYSRWLAGLSQESGAGSLALWPGAFVVGKEFAAGIDFGVGAEFDMAFAAIERGGVPVCCASVEVDVERPSDERRGVAEMAETMLREAKALFAHARLLNPAEYGLLAVRLWFEKLLFWLSPLFVYTAFLANLVLAFMLRIPTYQAIMSLQSIFYIAAFAGYLRRSAKSSGVLFDLYGFVRATFAAALMWQNYSNR